ncbi:hypothetical protein B6V74_00175 [Thioclava sp. F42-5]|uniref:universal stress protein n=1 Tax=Thioclava sp. F42-5 TaxID=1973005 RepID=UPI000B54789C|nr:universal stress protein [Thioclava sp. F42-5]OWY10488.1 hypothetical protein B6V74_00175 [Thioclava sp. F42-5]
MAEHILVATDGSVSGDNAVTLAARLALALGLDLKIAHVRMHDRPAEEWLRMAEIEHLVDDVTPGPRLEGLEAGRVLADLLERGRSDAQAAQALTTLGEQVLERASERAHKMGARRIKTRLLWGDTADAILELAASERPQMLVMGSRGLGRLRGAVLGSVSQKVLHHAPCAVVISPAPQPGKA